LTWTPKRVDALPPAAAGPTNTRLIIAATPRSHRSTPVASTDPSHMRTLPHLQPATPMHTPRPHHRPTTGIQQAAHRVRRHPPETLDDRCPCARQQPPLPHTPVPATIQPTVPTTTHAPMHDHRHRSIATHDTAPTTPRSPSHVTRIRMSLVPCEFVKTPSPPQEHHDCSNTQPTTSIIPQTHRSNRLLQIASRQIHPHLA